MGGGSPGGAERPLRRRVARPTILPLLGGGANARRRGLPSRRIRERRLRLVVPVRVPVAAVQCDP